MDVINPILYKKNTSPEKLRNLPEVTQPRYSRVRILTNRAAMVGKMIQNKETWSKEALGRGLRAWRAHRPSSEADPSLYGSMG